MLRDYVFFDATRSFCRECHTLVDAKIIIKNGSAYLLKRCAQHGEQLELFEEDASYLLERHRYDKPGTVIKPDTKIREGCPFDCGLCPDHEQHTCIALLEITQRCDLACPVCFAAAGGGDPLPLDRIEAMMDFVTRREGGRPEILQISGGEPTTHPQIEQVLSLAKRKKFKYVMLNTNGVRIARDPDFAAFLGSLIPGFEVYLQFDGLSDAVYRRLRGTPLLDSKMSAIANLQAAHVPMTLVTTVARGVNDDRIGEVVRYGLETDFVRGVNFQPVTFAGRGERGDIANRVTLSGVRREIARQTNGTFEASDIIPLPCDVDRVAVTYAVKKDGRWIPVTSKIEVGGYLELIDNTMDFRAEDLVKNAIAGAITHALACDCLRLKDEILAILPEGYVRWSPKDRAALIDTNTFRITISSFIDEFNFDAKSVRKECVHVITPDLRRIPFSVYNMRYRPGTPGALAPGRG